MPGNIFLCSPENTLGQDFVLCHSVVVPCQYAYEDLDCLCGSHADTVSMSLTIAYACLA